MVAKSGHSPSLRSSSQIELSEQLSHLEVNERTPSSSDDLEDDTGVSTSSKDQHQQESITLIDVTPAEFEHLKPGFSFRELARFFGPGLLTCVAYVVSKIEALHSIRLTGRSWPSCKSACRILAILKLTCKLVAQPDMPCYGCSLCAPSW